MQWRGDTLLLAPFEVSNERFDVDARLRLHQKRLDGDLFARWGVLSLGVGLEDGEKQYHLVGARRWFDGGPSLFCDKVTTDEDPLRTRLLRRHAALPRPRLARVRDRDALRGLRTATGPARARTGPLLPRGADLHRGDLHDQAGAQRLAAELGLLLVAPDTSPRQPRLPGDDASWDFGLGAGFYVDATEAPWSANYRMYSYVARELPELVAADFRRTPRAAASSVTRWAGTARSSARCATPRSTFHCRPSHRSRRRCSARGAARRSPVTSASTSPAGSTTTRACWSRKGRSTRRSSWTRARPTNSSPSN